MASNLFFMLSSLFMHSLLNLFIVTVIIVFLCSNRLRHGIEALSRTVNRWGIFSQIGFTEHANEVPRISGKSRERYVFRFYVFMFFVFLE